MAKTLTEAIEGLGLPKEIVYNLAISSNSLAVYQNAVSHPIGEQSKEEVALCYTVGTLKFVAPEFKEAKKGDRYGLLNMDLFNLDGTWNGQYLTIWHPQIAQTDDLGKVPVPKYTDPWDKVLKPIPPPDLRANSNASYEFQGNGGTGKGILYATGPANLLLTKVVGGGAIFQVSVAAYITGGTGDFEGAVGTNTALGSSFVPAGVTDINSVPLGQEIGGVTISTFRFVRKSKQATS